MPARFRPPDINTNARGCVSSAAALWALVLLVVVAVFGVVILLRARPEDAGLLSVVFCITLGPLILLTIGAYVAARTREDDLAEEEAAFAEGVSLRSGGEGGEGGQGGQGGEGCEGWRTGWGRNLPGPAGICRAIPAWSTQNPYESDSTEAGSGRVMLRSAQHLDSGPARLRANEILRPPGSE